MCQSVPGRTGSGDPYDYSTFPTVGGTGVVYAETTRPTHERHRVSWALDGLALSAAGRT